jgi:hypothetical protein
LKFVLHWHWLPEHVAFMGHSAFMQHPVEGMHWFPHALNVALHWMPQFVPSQVAWPFDGTLHAEHDAPHELRPLLGAQTPLQSCVIPEHWFMHAFCMGMQVPAHGFCPSGQRTPHLDPSHVASPPVGAKHGEHDPPHVLGSTLLTQALSHSCWPCGHAHAPLWQLAPVGQSRASQHWFDGIHCVPQRFVPSLQAQVLATHDCPEAHSVVSQQPFGGTQVVPQWRYPVGQPPSTSGMGPPSDPTSESRTAPSALDSAVASEMPASGKGFPAWKPRTSLQARGAPRETKMARASVREQAERCMMAPGSLGS